MIHVLPTRAQLVHQLNHRHHVACRPHAIRAADADHVWLAPLGAQLFGQLMQLGGALRAFNPMLSRTEQFIQQKISFRQRGLFPVQNQFALQPGFRRRGRSLPAMIRLRRSQRDERIRALCQGITNKKFQLARLVATER